MTTITRAVPEEHALAFLAGGRIAVVGASTEKANFGGTVYRTLRDHGCDVVAVHPGEADIDGDTTYPDLASVPGPVEGVIVMVGQQLAPAVVREAAARGVGRVWLFKGLGGPGALSDEAVAVARHYGLDVVAGACPLMFLEPVGLAHRVHRAARRATGSLVRST
jgi:predicted CoA-binding protein